MPQSEGSASFSLDEARPPAIEIAQLVVNYGTKRAVDGLSLVVPVGSIFGFLGPNGSGKTTTIKALLGLRKPDGGSARVFRCDVIKESLEVRARVGYVSEVNSLYDFLTVPQLCAFCRSTSRQWDQAQVDRAVRAFGPPTNKKVGQFSRGMKSQLALSLALGSNPDLLILDEPTAGLDPMARHEFLNTLVTDLAARGKTIFFSSHILSEVEALADWVGIIRSGKLVISDRLEQLKQTQQVLKLTYTDLPSAAEIEMLQRLPTVASVTREGRTVRLLTRGDAAALRQTIEARSSALREMAMVDMNLEDLFLEYLKEESNGR